MTNTHASLSQLSDDELLAEVHRCAADERQATARLIASLAPARARSSTRRQSGPLASLPRPINRGTLPRHGDDSTRSRIGRESALRARSCLSHTDAAER